MILSAEMSGYYEFARCRWTPSIFWNPERFVHIDRSRTSTLFRSSLQPRSFHRGPYTTLWFLELCRSSMRYRRRCDLDLDPVSVDANGCDGDALSSHCGDVLGLSGGNRQRFSLRPSCRLFGNE